MSRAHIALKTKLAAVICRLFEIPHEHAKLMTEDQVLSLVQWHHYPIPHEAGGTDTHDNLEAMPIKAHREHEAKVGTPTRSKIARIVKKNAAPVVDLSQLLETISRPRPKAKIRSHGFQQKPKGYKHNWGKRSFR